MDDRSGVAATDAIVVSEAYAAARELLHHAEQDAARIRADADRYRRQREQEAELLVAKARRLLTMAEQRAATLSTVVPDATAPPANGLEAPPPDIDLRTPDPQAAPRAHNEFNAILATAVSNAINRALPADG